jgi:3-oxoacyl-[acyl-carrier protein] reductase
MREQSPDARNVRGAIVNIASIGSFMGLMDVTAYVSAKTAVVGLTRGLANEWAQHGIRVNAIAPGMILTNFSRHNFTDENGEVVPEKLEQYHKRASAMAPLGRAGEGQDVANSFLYLVSGAASFVTGQIERPNGGVSMPW